jgi:hypothetical protein
MEMEMVIKGKIKNGKKKIIRNKIRRIKVIRKRVKLNICIGMYILVMVMERVLVIIGLNMFIIL